MAGIDKTVENIAKTERKASGLSYAKRQPHATVTYCTFKRSFPIVGKRKNSGTIKTANIPMQLTQIFPGRPHVRLTEFTKVKTGLV